jgi:hypothetical protein
MHPYTAQRIAAERLADLHRAAARPAVPEAWARARRWESLRRLLRFSAGAVRLSPRT